MPYMAALYNKRCLWHNYKQKEENALATMIERIAAAEEQAAAEYIIGKAGQA